MTSQEPPKFALTAMATYRTLMEELKARHAVLMGIHADAKEKNFAFAPYIVGELCYLQLRMICELIALGCLFMHGDIPATRTKRMQKAYAADWIISGLTRLHPNFYPLPGTRIIDEAGKTGAVKPNTKPHLTRADLLALYAECGTVLHRGTLKAVMAAETKHIDLSRAFRWTAKITQLLNHHQIPLTDDRYQVWVMMEGREGRVHCELMERFNPEEGQRNDAPLLPKK